MSNPIQPTVSFEGRREMMKKVEHMVAEAEALSKTRKLVREDVHLSEASTSESESGFANVRQIIPPSSETNSHNLNSGSEKSSSQGSLLSAQEYPSEVQKSRIENCPKVTSLANDFELEALETPRCGSYPFKHRHRPQDKSDDRSTGSTVVSASKLDWSITSKQSFANSNATPLYYYQGLPVNSPQFTLEPPSIVNSNSKSRYIGPKATNTATSSKSSREALLAMKKEIEALTAQFETLDEPLSRRSNNDASPKHSSNLRNAAKAFEEGVDIMGKKTDGMINALHNSILHSSKLQRDNDNLRDCVWSLGKDHTSRRQLKDDGVREGQPLILEENTTPPKKQTSHLSKAEILDDLGSSDDYCKRVYPAVSKTPGTMFVTEIVEVMNLDVGDHSYLSEIMDRQWDTTLDYFPRKH